MKILDAIMNAFRLVFFVGLVFAIIAMDMYGQNKGIQSLVALCSLANILLALDYFVSKM